MHFVGDHKSTLTTKSQIHRQLETAVAHHQAGRLKEAEPIYRRVLATQPQNTDALYLLGLVTQATKRFAESAGLFQRAVELNPKSAKYLINLGLSLGGMGLGKTEQAAEAFRRAVAIDPNNPAAWNNLGNELRNSYQFDEAMECYQKALKLKPDFADAYCNVGACLQATQPTLRPAIAAYEKAIALQPDFATAHWNLGFALLLLGDYARGLPEYEWRFKTRTVVRPRNFPQPLWDGSNLAGKRILLHAEQGLGDTIQMARYLPMVAARGGKAILECPSPLVRLLSNLPGLDQIVASGQPLPAFDVQCTLMSLPLVFKTTLETIPAPVPYLYADPNSAEDWSKRFPPDRAIKRIGLVWAGRPENKNDRNRSMRLDQFAPLSVWKNVKFYSLQKGAAADEARNPPAGMELIDNTNDLDDFTDTAAMLVNLDLLVTVDTSVAHLAGAMGKPVWVLLPFMPDWRWILNRDDTPWYPTMRLFRQKVRGDWGEMMERVKEAIEKSAATE